MVKYRNHINFLPLLLLLVNLPIHKLAVSVLLYCLSFWSCLAWILQQLVKVCDHMVAGRGSCSTLL